MNDVNCCWGDPDEVYYTVEGSDEIHELDLRENGYVFGIWDGVFIQGRDDDDTACLMHDEFIIRYIYENGWSKYNVAPSKEVNDGAWEYDIAKRTKLKFDGASPLKKMKLTYGDLLDIIGTPRARGRVLVDYDNGWIDFVAFWGEPTLEEKKIVLKHVGSPYVILFNNKIDAYDFYIKEGNKVPTMKEWIESGKSIPRIKRDDEKFALHNMKAKDKWNNTSSFRDTRDKKNAEKLGNMTMAQYHNLIRQESKSPSSKKIYISENQLKNVLNEGLSNILYHFTSLGGGYSICAEDKIYLQSAFAKESDNYDKKRKFYLSCTRQRSSDFGYSRKFRRGGVRVVLDGDLLAQRYKGKTVNYWGGGVFKDKFKYYDEFPKSKEELDDRLSWDIGRLKKNNPNITDDEIQHFKDYNFNRDAQEHNDNESEDRLFSYDSVINDAHKYIKSIDVLIINEDEGKFMQLAQDFKFHTALGKYVRIFNSVKEFNNPNGKDVNDSLEYSSDSKGINSEKRNTIFRYIDAVVSFIAYANPNFEGNKFGKSVSQLLDKYELSEFKGNIGEMMSRFKRLYGLSSVEENLNSVRRNLSDKPNLYTSKIIKMLTDYMLSLGADSFPQGIRIKREIANEYYDNMYGRSSNFYEKIDTEEKNAFYTFGYVVSLNPNKDLFRDAVSWNDDDLQMYAQDFTSAVIYDYDGNNYNHSKSKNENSLFHYIWKTFRKGTVSQVKEMFDKIGFNEEYLNSYGLFKVKELNYWNLSNYNSVNTNKMSKENNNLDYKVSLKQNEKDIQQYYIENGKVSKN
jgi:hypothetical protein